MGVTYFAQPAKRYEVGFTKVNGRLLTYSRIPKDQEGFAEAAKYLPLKGELCTLKVGNRSMIGWWGGAYWFGRYLKEKDRVDKWKPMEFNWDA